MEKLSAKKNKRQKPSLSLRDISPRGRDKFGLCVILFCTQKEAPQVRSLFVLPRTILADVSFS